MISLWLSLSVALAHDVRPGVLALAELDAERFAWTWQPPVHDRMPLATKPLEIRWPEGCVETTSSDLRCAQGFRGSVQIEGLAGRLAPTAVSLTRADGTVLQATLQAGQDTVTLGPSPSPKGPLSGSALGMLGAGALLSVAGALARAPQSTGATRLLGVFLGLPAGTWLVAATWAWLTSG